MQVTDILDAAAVYRVWQLPFRRAKLAPVLRANDLAAVGKVLDVGCGPGTNAGVFRHAEYLGLDLNESYLDYARQRYPGRFQRVDVRDYVPPHGTAYDFILVNSFLHHVNDEDVRRILERLEAALEPLGHVHIVDLVLPEKSGVPRWLAHHDRGGFARPLEHWRSLFCSVFSPAEFQPFALSLPGVDLWSMVYFKGGRRAHG